MQAKKPRNKVALRVPADKAASPKMAARQYQSCLTPYRLRIHLTAKSASRSRDMVVSCDYAKARVRRYTSFWTVAECSGPKRRFSPQNQP
jgi:hypothetical protein